MTNVFVVGYSKELSAELRAKRQLTLHLENSSSLVSEFVIVVDQGTPIWIAEIENFVAPAGAFPKDIIIALGQTVFLENKWTEVSEILKYEKRLEVGKILPLDVESLLRTGDAVTTNDEPRQGVISVTEARSRLSWTYGVTEERVRITIEL